VNFVQNPLGLLERFLPFPVLQVLKGFASTKLIRIVKKLTTAPKILKKRSLRKNSFFSIRVAFT
jgi:hypothetical protein